MNLQIERPYVEILIGAFPRLAPLRDQLRFGSKVTLPLYHLNCAELGFLGGLYREAGPAMRSRAAQLATLQRAFDGQGPRFGADDDLEMLMPAIARFLATDALHGWLFRVNVADRPLAYVVTRLDYVAASNDETGKVMLELKANAKGALATATIRIAAADIAGRTVAEILAAKGYVRESAELVSAYDDTAERYFDWRGQYGAQFSGQGTGFYAEDPTATHRDTDWSRKDVVVLSSGGGAARLVNDEGILGARATTLEATGDILGPYLRKAAKSNHYHAEDEVSEFRAAMPKGLFTRLPVHPYLFLFHLDLHHYLWVHVDDLAPYAYQPALKHKLVLPPEQTDLIDILTAEMDVLMDDIVAGKSGGTTVLCAGPPGVGKTLTAEVYSEIIQRPLYRVHSGQLGLNVAAMETALKDVLTRAQRWGAVMLIDEADVYIKRRDDKPSFSSQALSAVSFMAGSPVHGHGVDAEGKRAPLPMQAVGKRQPAQTAADNHGIQHRPSPCSIIAATQALCRRAGMPGTPSSDQWPEPDLPPARRTHGKNVVARSSHLRQNRVRIIPTGCA